MTNTTQAAPVTTSPVQTNVVNYAMAYLAIRTHDAVNMGRLERSEVKRVLTERRKVLVEMPQDKLCAEVLVGLPDEMFYHS